MKSLDRRVLVIAIAMLVAAACSGNKSPQTIAATVAHNGTVLVHAVDDVQKYVIAQEASGVIPRNVAVTAMEGIGRGLGAAQHAKPVLDRLALLPSGSPDAGGLVQQVQADLALVTKEVVGLVIPGAPDPVKQQIATLAAQVSAAIDAAQAQIAKVKGGQ